jgi:hypothetical protein
MMDVLDPNLVSNLAAAGTIAYIIGKAIYDFLTGLTGGEPPPKIAGKLVTKIIPEVLP